MRRITAEKRKLAKIKAWGHCSEMGVWVNVNWESAKPQAVWRTCESGGDRSAHEPGATTGRGFMRDYLRKAADCDKMPASHNQGA
jgi:hypothetical protein